MIPGGHPELDGRAAVAAEIQMTSINKILVPGEGIEPTRCHHHRILSPARLPVPPSGHQAQQYMRLELLVEWSADAAHGLSLRSPPGSHCAAASGDPLRQPD